MQPGLSKRHSYITPDPHKAALAHSCALCFCLRLSSPGCTSRAGWAGALLRSVIQGSGSPSIGMKGPDFPGVPGTSRLRVRGRCQDAGPLLSLLGLRRPVPCLWVGLVSGPGLGLGEALGAPYLGRCPVLTHSSWPGGAALPAPLCSLVSGCQLDRSRRRS